jgi:hypothetical protein
VIWLPIWGITSRLTQAAQQDPKTAMDLVRFLQEYRPLQTQLAMHIAHAATAGDWRQNPLNEEILNPPPLIEKAKKLLPSANWLQALENLKQQLIAYRQESGFSQRQLQFAEFIQQLQQFRQQTLNAPSHWHQYYLPAIDSWMQQAELEQDNLKLEAETEEPITPNVYRAGEVLNPKLNQSIFFGREKLKQDFSRQVLTASEMPLFLIYGQRRVGKTSLLKFLPSLLGSRFKLIYQDCQSECIQSVQTWLQDLRRLIDKAYHQPPINWTAPENWLEAWRQFREYLEQLCQEQQHRIILAFDEYEALHQLLEKFPEQADNLLGAMRHFSQHQNQVVFLFVGATQFIDLKNPDWNAYFIQAVRFPVDYLNASDTEKLITEPVDLHYPPTVVQRIIELTQGHPTLVQMCCRNLVDIANAEGRKEMTMADLEAVLKTILIRDQSVLSVFWTQFCVYHQCRDAVNQIIERQPITDKKGLIKLEDYKYIEPDDEGNWRFRVPLLAQWLQRYRETL